MSKSEYGLTVENVTKWEHIQKRDFQEASNKLQAEILKGSEKGYDFNGLSQDFFSLLYKTKPDFPQSAPTPGTAWAKKAIDELRELPEFKNMRENTKCDSFRSGIGTTVFSKHFAESLEKMEKENPDDLQEELKSLEDLMESMDTCGGKVIPEELHEQLESVRQKATEAAQAWQEAADALDPAAIRQGFRRACESAGQEIEEIDNAVRAYGIGTSPGDEGFTDTAQKVKIAKMLEENQKLKKISELAGRFRSEAKQKQSSKKNPGPDELTDIETGNEISRLLPSELMKLNHPLMRRAWQRSYLERSLLQYKLEEVEQEDRGPIVFCIDSSGSMKGQKEVWSKAILLAIAQIAMDQKRTFEVIHFTSEVARKDIFPAGKSDPMKLIETCAFFASGGTDFVPPLRSAIADIVIEKGNNDLSKADIIFISDGISNIPTAQKEFFTKDKEDHNINLYSILLGVLAPDLEEISTELTRISDFATDGEDVKEQLFSI